MHSEIVLYRDATWAFDKSALFTFISCVPSRMKYHIKYYLPKAYVQNGIRFTFTFHSCFYVFTLYQIAPLACSAIYTNLPVVSPVLIFKHHFCTPIINCNFLIPKFHNVKHVEASSMPALLTCSFSFSTYLNLEFVYLTKCTCTSIHLLWDSHTGWSNLL